MNDAQPALRRSHHAGAVAHEPEPHVVHVIPSVQIGGAESTLLKLVRATLPHGVRHEVITLLQGNGPIGDALREIGVPVRSLGLTRGAIRPGAVLRLARWIRESDPHVVHTWMYHADLMGGLATRLSGRPTRVIWSLRRTLDPRHTPRRTVAVARACGVLSRWVPSAIVSCAGAIVTSHVALGYQAGKVIVIPNGFDTDLLRPLPEAREPVRQEWRVPAGAHVIGLLARYDPAKDHETFLQAAAALSAARQDVVFVLGGRDIVWENDSLRQSIVRRGLEGAVRLVGEVSDVARFHAGVDVAALTSVTEGFPNVVAEAMACGVPCVVTDVGAAAEIVGDTGYVVKPAVPGETAAAWAALLSEPAEAMAERRVRARGRVVERFSLAVSTSRYCQLYYSLTTASAARG